MFWNNQALKHTFCKVWGSQSCCKDATVSMRAEIILLTAIPPVFVKVAWLTWKQPKYPYTEEWAKEMWCTYTVEYCSAIKRNKTTICRDMSRPRGCHTEWSKSGRENQVSLNITYMWNLEKQYQWTYFQRRNRDIDIENGHMDNKVRRGGEANWEIRLDRYTPVFGSPSHLGHHRMLHIVFSTQCRFSLWESKKGGICVSVADSLCYIAETDTL